MFLWLAVIRESKPMFDSKTWKIYRLTSGYGGIKSNLIYAPDQYKAIAVFCRLHTLFPAQVAVIYSHPYLAH
jgi:hypothetical protein